MKKLILFSLILISSHQANAGWPWSSEKEAVEKAAAFQAIVNIVTPLMDTKKNPAPTTFDHFYDRWVMQDIFHTMDEIQSDKKLKAVSKKLFEQFIDELGKIAQKRKVALANPHLKLETFPKHEVGSRHPKPAYTPTLFQDSVLHDQYQERLAKKGNDLAEKLAHDEVSETIVDRGNAPQEQAQVVPVDDATNSDDGDSSSEVSFSDDRSGVVAQQMRQMGQLDRNAPQSITEQLLQNKFALSCGAGAVALLVYKYHKQIQAWFDQDDTDAPQASSSEEAPSQENGENTQDIAQTLEQLKQMIAKGK